MYSCNCLTLTFYANKNSIQFLKFISYIPGRVLLVLMVFSIATIPLHYLASFYFEAAATGFSKMCFMNIFTGKCFNCLDKLFIVFIYL